MYLNRNIDTLTWGPEKEGFKCCVTTAKNTQLSGSDIELTVNILSLRDQEIWISSNDEVSAIWKTNKVLKLGLKLFTSLKPTTNSIKLEKNLAASFQVKATPCSDLPPGEYDFLLACRPMFGYGGKAIFTKQEDDSELLSNPFSLSIELPQPRIEAVERSRLTPYFLTGVKGLGFIRSASLTSLHSPSVISL